jgi:hypothetical protein
MAETEAGASALSGDHDIFIDSATWRPSGRQAPAFFSCRAAPQAEEGLKTLPAEEKL